MKGAYSYSITGVRPAGSAPGQFEQLLGVGVRVFDGRGGMTQIHTEKGSLSPSAVVDVASVGAYTVNLDCTARLFWVAAQFSSVS